MRIWIASLLLLLAHAKGPMTLHLKLNTQTPLPGTKITITFRGYIHEDPPDPSGASPALFVFYRGGKILGETTFEGGRKFFVELTELSLVKVDEESATLSVRPVKEIPNRASVLGP